MNVPPIFIRDTYAYSDSPIQKGKYAIKCCSKLYEDSAEKVHNNKLASCLLHRGLLRAGYPVKRRYATAGITTIIHLHFIAIYDVQLKVLQTL